MNVVTLIGRLTADPDARTVTVSGEERTVTTLGLAVPHDRDPDGEPVYVDVTVWGRPARACATWLRRGRRVAVTGRLDLTRWTGENGTARRAHRVVATSVDFLDGPRDGPPSGNGARRQQTADPTAEEALP
jgi:single-strand DNA-binding protein